MKKAKTISLATRIMQNAKKRMPKHAMRSVKRALVSLNTEAAPGASGNINKVIAMVHQRRDGPYQPKSLTDLWISGYIRPADAARLTTTVLSPINQGWEEAEQKCKIRPVSLMECLLKHVETIVVQHRLRNIREEIEPEALPPAITGGILATIRILRSWAYKADEEDEEQMVSDEEDDDDHVEAQKDDGDDFTDCEEGTEGSCENHTPAHAREDEETNPKIRSRRRMVRQIRRYTRRHRGSRREKNDEGETRWH